jgi:lambda family phage portal protein
MAILDLHGAAPIEGYASRRPAPTQKRTLGDPGTLPPGALNGGGSAGAAAARIDRLTQDFIGRLVSADTELFDSNPKMRARMRLLALNNPYVRKWLAMIAQNVVGPTGILLKSDVRNADGSPAKRINKRIEEEWKRWGMRGSCTADGKFSWVRVQHLAIRLAASEGESLTKYVYGRQFNRTAFTLQPLDNDQLDDTMMAAVDNGNQVRMGVEVDEYYRPVAYHLFTGHPFDIFGRRNRERKRVPAEYINHAAVWERPAQTRGFTWASAVVQSLNHYSGYSEAVVVAARASAAKFFAIEKTQAEGLYTGDEDDEADEAGSELQSNYSANSGEGFRLENGEHLNFVDPRFPTANHKQFMQTMVREFATGLLADYPTLANDLEGVNFSSIRAGMLDVRDAYRVIQRWFIEDYCSPIQQAWLSMALTTTLSDITLTPLQMEQMVWQARGWDWVDPLKDAQAIVLKLQNGLITYAKALADLGIDFEEAMTERAQEQAFIEALGITLGTDIRGQADTAEDDTMDSQPTQDGKPSGTKKPTKARLLELDSDDRAALIERARVFYRVIREHAD